MNRTQRIVGKTAARGRRGMVVAHNVEAAEVGASVLQDGGTAFDAAIAASMTTAVRETAMNSIGGVGVLLAHSAATGRTTEINFYGRTPRGLAEDTFVPYLLERDAARAAFGWRGVAESRNERGALSVGVPTYVAGLAELHARHATRPWRDLLQPAIELAEAGYVADEEDVNYFANHFTTLNGFAEFRRVFLGNGIPMPSGFYQGMGLPVVQSDLAATLRTIAEQGPEAFYSGPIAETLAAHVQRLGGFLSTQDLADYRPSTSEGMVGSYRGYEIVTTSGMTGGLTLLEMLNLAEQFDLGAMDRRDGEFWHVLAEIHRQAWTDRFCYVGDPEGVDVPTDALVDKAYAQSLMAGFPRHEAPERSRPGDPWGHLGRTDPASARATDPGGKDTTHLAVADAEGNVVTLTQTLGLAFGSCVVVPTTGVLLYDVTMWMNPEPGTPNSVGPWKNQLGHATPVMIKKDGVPVAALGAPGGRRVVSAMFQTVVNMIDFGMDVQTAIGEPRIHIEGADPSAPEGPAVRTLLVDDRLDEGIIADLRRRGHDVQPVRETGTQAYLAKPLGIEFADGELIGGVDVFRRSTGIGV